METPATGGIAYLVLAHQDPAGLAALAQALRSPVSATFVHLDRRARLEQFGQAEAAGAIFIADRVYVHRAEWSVMEATLNLINAALDDPRPFTWFALISGADHPLSTPERLLAHLDAVGREHIDTVPMPGVANRKPISRLSAWRVEGRLPGFGARLLGRLVNACLARLPPREVAARLSPWRAHAGSQWWVLSREAVMLALAAARAGGPAVRLFETSLCPDESFIQTVIASTLPPARCVRGVTYSDWRGGGVSPAWLSDEQIDRITTPGFTLEGAQGRGPCFFARKLAPGDLQRRRRLDGFAASRTDLG